MLAKNVQDMFGLNRKEWLEQARVTAKRILNRQPTVTIEDVLKECPRPDYVSRMATGSVFRNPDFVAVGYAISKRRSAHARPVMVWALDADQERAY